MGFHTIAAHHFHAIAHGERCFRPDCEGEGRLSVLVRDADTYTINQPGISHYGGLTEGEINQIKQARNQINENMERAMSGFGRA